MSNKTESFTSRFGFLISAIGMAVGAGNIWRFPRLAGQYGGTFLIPIFLFLFLWSIPLLMVEFSVGKKTKYGIVASFSSIAGRKYSWMGLFVAFCTASIMFYYSVVCGWSLKYLMLSVGGSIFKIDHDLYWSSYSNSIIQPVLYHLAALVIGSAVIYRGITSGIEKFSKLIVPLLFLLLILAMIKAISLDGSEAGISYFFNFDFTKLKDHSIWLDGLSQSAWSTGAGWGLFLTYAIYSGRNKQVIGNSTITGLGDNLASILAGLVIIPTVFALSPDLQTVNHSLQAGNQGLTFIILPRLFDKIPAGQIFISIFFLALFFATITSLISMIELVVRIFMNIGLSRKRSVYYITTITAIMGIPSAVSMDILNNQDWVWGLGLILSGSFFTFLVLKTGVKSFVTDWLQPSSFKKTIQFIFQFLFYVIIPLEFTGMLVWWFWQSVEWDSSGWWNPFKVFSLGTVLFQWLLVCILGIFLSKKTNFLIRDNI